MATTRADSLMSSDSGLNDSDIGGSDPELKPSLLDNSGLSRIFMDAVQYSEAISEQGDDTGEDDEDTNSEKSYENEEPTTRRLADILGRGLSTPELVASERYAKFAVMKEGDMLGGADSLGDATEESQTAPAIEEPKPTAGPDKSPYEPHETTRTTSISQLSSEQIVDIFIDEFGPLTVDDNDTEKLIWETDGAYLQEVAILGIIHLTTHRITFHASLLSTRPDLLPEKQLIRSGPVTLHRKGWRRKQRLWLELSHDMLTVFPSSKEEDRIRPIRSCLLSSIKKVAPEDENHPRVVKLEFGPDHYACRYAEFDTVESAREWRREVQAAVFMFSRDRTSYLNPPAEDDMRGVQISIPLSRVKSSTTRLAPKYATILSMELSSGRLRTSLSVDSDLDEPGKGNDSSPPSDDEDIDIDGRTIELGVPRTTHTWDDFEERVAETQARQRRAGFRTVPKVIVDFGALNYVEQRPGNEAEDDTRASIRRALAIRQEEECWYTRARLSRSITSYGYFVISKRFIGFWTKCLSIRDAKYRYPLGKVVGARPNFRYMLRTFGMILILREHPSMHFDFASQEQRDEVIRRVNEAVKIHQLRKKSSSSVPSPLITPFKGTFLDSISNGQLDGGVFTSSPPPITPPARSNSSATISGSGTNSSVESSAVPVALPTVSHVLSPLEHTLSRANKKCLPPGIYPNMPKIINLPSDTLPHFCQMHFVCLTIGSRGDIQPYIGLGQRLLKEGHRVTIVTHEEYKEWIEGWGINHRTAGGDPGALMKLSVDHKMFSPQFFKESLGHFRTWLDELLVDAWEACKDADVLLESPSAMAGVHIAEALDIPYFRTFTMPWSKTSEFPHPFLSTPVELPQFNTTTYILFDNILWTATAGQINRWRRNTLHIKDTDMGHLAQAKIPFIYNFSPSVVPKPLDWGDQITISGCWFLDNPDLDWTPPETLLDWMAKARDDGRPIVYIGFGSITVPNPPAMTRSIVKAVRKSGVRAIISKGWSARMSKSDEPEYEFPPECYPIDKIPHDWLFPQIDAALHHGGAGTTGASLRAGIPTLIKPWFGDQFFWATRVQKIGAGMKVSSLHSSELANALVRATSDRIMKERAASVGENIRLENGTQNALHAIYIYLDRAGRVRKEQK